MSLSGIYGAFSRALSYNFVVTSLYEQASDHQIGHKAIDCHCGLSLLHLNFPREVALFGLFLFCFVVVVIGGGVFVFFWGRSWHFIVMYVCTFMLMCI